MTETDLERSARLLAHHLRAALPHAKALFQANTEAGLEARASMRVAVDARDDAALAKVIFFIEAIQTERTRTIAIDQGGHDILTRENPFL